jgi:hypothetical protein
MYACAHLWIYTIGGGWRAWRGTRHAEREGREDHMLQCHQVESGDTFEIFNVCSHDLRVVLFWSCALRWHVLICILSEIKSRRKTEAERLSHRLASKAALGLFRSIRCCTAKIWEIAVCWFSQSCKQERKVGTYHTCTQVSLMS